MIYDPPRMLPTTTGPLKCAWCGEPVETPQRDWQPGQAAYCAGHRSIAGNNPWSIGQIALSDAVDFQDADASAFLRWPWQSVHDLAGVLAPRRVYYVAAFPSNGKTTFLAECFSRWLADGHRVSYLPLESDPSETMTRVACARAHVSADEALSFRLRLRADAGDPSARNDLARLHEAFNALRQDNDFLNQFRIDPTSTLSPKAFQKVIERVHALESDVLIVDHVDHAEADSDDFSPEIKVSNKLQTMALNAARDLSIPVVLATQLNSGRTGGDRLAHYRAPLMDWLFNKGKKEQIGAVCLGLYRPMDPAQTEQIGKVRSGLAEPHTITKPHRMGVAGMKLRFGGELKERSIELHYERGQLRDLDPAESWSDAQTTHGIHTHFEDR